MRGFGVDTYEEVEDENIKNTTSISRLFMPH